MQPLRLEVCALTIESSKVVGGVGALLLLLGSLPYIGEFSFGVLGLVGVIMIFVALNGFAGYYKERGIFTSAVYALVVGIVGVVVTVSVALYFLFDTDIITNFLKDVFPSWNGSWTSISSLAGSSYNTSNLDMGHVAAFLGALFAVLVVVWVFAIVAAFYVRRSLRMVAEKTSVKHFGTAGLLVLIGAFLLIIFVGFILLWVAEILLIIAFFAVKTDSSQPMMGQAAPPSTVPTPV